MDKQDVGIWQAWPGKRRLGEMRVELRGAVRPTMLHVYESKR